MTLLLAAPTPWSPADDQASAAEPTPAKYPLADFFSRVRGQVDVAWRPSLAHRLRDIPLPQVVETVLAVELDRAGAVVALTVHKTSGVDFMDAEAERAFRFAAPFADPPARLFGEDGKLRFHFTFRYDAGNTERRLGFRLIDP